MIRNYLKKKYSHRNNFFSIVDLKQELLTDDLAPVRAFVKKVFGKKNLRHLSKDMFFDAVEFGLR